MNPAALPTWDMLTADAEHRRVALLEHVRQWAAHRHVATGGQATPSRVIAALDALARPMRTRLARLDASTTQRELAQAAADDLWDATCATWAMVKAANAGGEPPTERVAAELAEVGRWLARFPVHAAGHDKALADLFHAAEVAA
jgi:hypothetical protein